MRKSAAGIVVASLTAIALAACGGSGSTVSQNGSAASAHPTIGAPLTLGGAAAPGAVTARYGASSSNARPTQGSEQIASKAARAPSRAFFRKALSPSVSEEATPSKQTIIDPCGLVSRAEAQAILGGTILSPKEAPLGPTCIYESAGHRAYVTLAVELRSFATLPSQQSSLRKFSGVGRQAYCGGTTGATGLFVRINADEVLDVTGPCQTAAKFAGHALGRLASVKGVPVQNP